MIIVQLPDNEKIIFEFTMNGHSFEFPTKITGKGNNYILAEPIRVSGKILSFNSAEKIQVNLVFTQKDKSPMVWKGVGVSVISIKGRQQYKVVASGEGYEVNRRNAFRLFVGINGIVQIGINRKAFEVIIKDISETGFSFVTSEDINNAEGLPVRMVFADCNSQFSLMGECVRKVVLAENKFLYGCQLKVENVNLQKYINEKQRQMLAINRGNSVAKSKAMLEQALQEPAMNVKVDTLTEADLKKMIHTSDAASRRNIGEVGKVERRDIFKDKIGGN